MRIVKEVLTTSLLMEATDTAFVAVISVAGRAKAYSVTL